MYLISRPSWPTRKGDRYIVASVGFSPEVGCLARLEFGLAVGPAVPDVDGIAEKTVVDAYLHPIRAKQPGEFAGRAGRLGGAAA